VLNKGVIVEELDKLLIKRFNEQIKELKEKHKAEIEKLKLQQAETWCNLRGLCDNSPKLIASMCKTLKA
jgi:hypothetical protein